jgi:hypothetical protein
MKTKQTTPAQPVDLTRLVRCDELRRGDVIEREGKRLIYHGYGSRRGSKLWQMQFKHEVSGGLVLIHLYPLDKVNRIPSLPNDKSAPAGAIEGRLK